MAEKPTLPEGDPVSQEQGQESNEALLGGITFIEASNNGAQKVYRSSAPDRKIMILSDTSPRPRSGREYTVRIVEDTKPEDPTKGKLIVEIVIDPEEQKQYMIELAEQTREAFAGNDFEAALERLRELREDAGMETKEESERTPSISEAQEIFKENFIGIKEVEKLIGFEFTPEEAAEINESWDAKMREKTLTREKLERLEREGFMVVLRSGLIQIDNAEQSMSINALRERFGYLFSDSHWYHNEPFARVPDIVHLGWAIVKKEPLFQSLDHNWEGQQKILAQWAKEHQVPSVRARSPLEAVYDIVLYDHSRTGGILRGNRDANGIKMLNNDGERLISVRNDPGIMISNDDKTSNRANRGIAPSL